jgi:hypothetical protein
MSKKKKKIRIAQLWDISKEGRHFQIGYVYKVEGKVVIKYLKKSENLMG